MIILILFAIALLLILSTFFRTLVLNFPLAFKYSFKDLFNWFRYRKWRVAKTGEIIAFCGLFGKGKTLSAVHYARKFFNRFNNKLIYDADSKRFVKQVVNIYSNVDLLSVPFTKFDNLQQIVEVSQNQAELDKKYGIKTVSLFVGDEFSTQLNSRNFKSNLSIPVLGSILTCRHANTSLIYTSQRFGHVDALLRQVTSYVIDCDKRWRIMCHKKFDAWDMENTSDIRNLKPLRRYGWFILDKDFNAYDTLANVENMAHESQEGYYVSDLEILASQGSLLGNEDDIRHKSHRLKKRLKKRLV